MIFLISLLSKIVEIYSCLLIVYALLSWIPSLYHSSLGRLVEKLVEPVIKPFRRVNLTFFGLDWTVFLVMILLQVGTEMVIRFLLFFV